MIDASPFTAKNRRQIILRVGAAFLLLAIRYVSNLPVFDAWASWRPFVQKFTVTTALILAVLILGNIAQSWIARHEVNIGHRYNLLRVTRLVTSIFVAILMLSFLFQNLYAAAASFGLISLVLGFALQSPISSFIAWLYIIFRKPYQVGDRIQLKTMRGDVVEIHYLDTILQECRGDYLSHDHPSGRLIHFPNSIVLNSEIINYSGALLPFIWNEAVIQVAYSSDMPFLEETLLNAAREDFAERYPEFAARANPTWEPRMYFRANKSNRAWMEAVISYPVKPTDTTERRNHILRKVMPRLNSNPELVQYPT